MHMLILLPPSEGKNSPESGKKLSLPSLSFADELTTIRKLALTSSIDISRCQPAHEIYSGVLYKALDWQSLSLTAQRRGEKSIIIISAIFGALRMNDVIPTYKSKISPSLWKESVSSVLEELNQDLIVDCRSSTYAGVWSSDPQRTVAIRVFQVKSGRQSVITHMSKMYRGQLTRYLLLEKASLHTPQDLKRVASKYFQVTLTPNQGKNPWYLDLLIPAG